jgi:hypothetical protein
MHAPGKSERIRRRVCGTFYKVRSSYASHSFARHTLMVPLYPIQQPAYPRLGYCSWLTLKKERETSQRILTDETRSRGAFPSLPLPLILRIQCRARVPFHYWLSFFQRQSCVYCARLGCSGPLTRPIPISSTTIPDNWVSKRSLH